MRCAVHGLAAGPDGRCALCHGDARRLSSNRARRRLRDLLRLLIALTAGLCAFAWLLAIFDTRPPEEESRSANLDAIQIGTLDAGADAAHGR